MSSVGAYVIGQTTICVNREGQCHRDDGPAIESVDGQKEWWINGKRHRDSGPAIIYPNGDQEWWINDQRMDPLIIFLHGTEVNNPADY